MLDKFKCIKENKNTLDFQSRFGGQVLRWILCSTTVTNQFVACPRAMLAGHPTIISLNPKYYSGYWNTISMFLVVPVRGSGSRVSGSLAQERERVRERKHRHTLTLVCFRN